jgi:hypothetical protein
MHSVEIENDFPWQSHHWKSIQTAYRTSPFFEYYEDDLRHLFTKPAHNLLDLNIRIFNLLCDILEIELPISETQKYEHLPKIIDLRPLIDAKSRVDYKFKTYTQVLREHHGFLPNLSVLDLIFNEGPNALNYLETQNITSD